MDHNNKIRGKIYRKCNALEVMESLTDSTYDFIFLDAPHFTGYDEMILFHEEKQADDLDYLEHIKKLALNAGRLLKENGVLAFLAPGKENIYINYKFILNQIFPEINNVVLEYLPSLSNKSLPNHYFLFFCAKQRGYIFPSLKELRPKEEYPYEDSRGAFRPCKLIVNKEYPALNFEWMGLVPKEEQSWRFKEEILDNFLKQDRIVFMEGKAFLKKYRHEEPMKQSSVWEMDLSDIRKLGGNVDIQTIERMVALFVRSEDNVLCPYDYDAKFSYIASRHDFYWTAVYYPKGASKDKPSNNILGISMKGTGKDTLGKVKNAEFIFTTNNESKNTIQYSNNLIGNADELRDLQTKIIQLSSSIRNIQNSLGINENEDEDESTIVDKIHELITKTEFAVNISDSIPEAQSWVTPYWDSLEPESQNFIPTGIMLYKQFINQPDMDMAPIMIEYCKALEKELYMKMFNGYILNLIERNVDIDRDFHDSFRSSNTKKFAEYLEACIGVNRNNPREWKIELGTMIYILKMALDRPHQYGIIGDFRRYLDNIFELPFFQMHFLREMGEIKALRNDCAHPYIVNSDRVRIGKEQIRSKLLSLLQHYKM